MVIEDQSKSTGSRFFVNATTGTDSTGYGTNPDSPLKSLDYAVGLCTANAGDIIYLMPGHAEDIVAATTAVLDIAGISVVGLGEGTNRPTFTVKTADAATVVVSAANVTLKNLLFVAGKDGLNVGITASGADFKMIDCECRDATNVEVDIWVTASGVRPVFQGCFFNGYTSGDQQESALSLNGCSGAVVDGCRFYGKYVTAAVSFDTACLGVVVKNSEFYSATTSDFSKSVVDTATGSVWEVTSCFDQEAGCNFSGGSGAALAGDDVSALSTAVSTNQSTIVSTFASNVTVDSTSQSTLVSTLGTKASSTAVSTVDSKIVVLTTSVSTNQSTLVSTFASNVTVDSTNQSTLVSTLATVAVASTQSTYQSTLVSTFASNVTVDSTNQSTLVSTLATLAVASTQSTYQSTLVSTFASNVTVDSTNQSTLVSTLTADQTTASTNQSTLVSTLANVATASVLSTLTLKTEQQTTKTQASLASATLFNYTGIIGIKRIVGVVTTNTEDAAATAKLSVTPDALGAYDICTTTSVQNKAAGTMLDITGTAADGLVVTAGGALAPGSQLKDVVAACVTSGTITVTYSAPITGVIKWGILWEPVTPGATVTAGA